MSLERAMPVLQVRDVAQSAAFYERLGFEAKIWGDPPGFAICKRGGVTLALDRAGDGTVPLNQWWAAYVYTADVEALRAEFVAAGLEPTEIHHPEHYGCDDFDVVDPDGHRIAFGQDRGGTFGL
ncbi:VOC family protein [Vannielia sp. SX4]|uniref:VOC family protein n=1 Tax=Vannielia sp. SX4 TaxID=3463852 RepID=UPI004059E8BB